MTGFVQKGHKLGISGSYLSYRTCQSTADTKQIGIDVFSECIQWLLKIDHGNY